jgi:Leucine-rich repeat (LRR) protein
LNLWKKRLGRVPDSVWGQTTLETLVLADNDLTEVSSQIGRLRALRMLDLGHNRLTKLRYLNISENGFEVLPECVCGMAGLIELRATDNKLISLPDGISRLTRLRELHVRNNKLTSLPEAIGEMLELRQIDLRGNPLTELPACLAALPRLEKVDLRWVTMLVWPGWLDELEARGCVVYR